MKFRKIFHHIKKLIPAGENDRQGFTLMELLVSATIIALMSTVTLANYRYYGNRNDMDITAQKLANDIRRVQSYALGLEDFKGSFPAGGWGIELSRNKNLYTIFADSEPFPPALPNRRKLNNNNEVFRNITFPQTSVQIDQKLYLTSCDGGSSGQSNMAYITFEPPGPTVYINGANNWNGFNLTNCELLEIVLQIRNTSFSKRVFVNKFGLVDVTD